MASLPRPLLALLVAVVAVFAVWTFALKPSSSSSNQTPAPAPVAAVHPAAHPAAKATAHTTTTRHAAKPLSAAHRATSALATLNGALAAHKLVALLFYNPAGSDDQADRQTLGQLSTRHGQVVKLAVPISQIARFSQITDQVAVTTSPTLIVIDAKHQASTLVGFADPLEFNQLISAAAEVK